MGTTKEQVSEKEAEIQSNADKTSDYKKYQRVFCFTLELRREIIRGGEDAQKDNGGQKKLIGV